MPKKDATLEEKFQELMDIMARLRAPGGCPWDREQTHESLRPYLLEETYEVLEAIDAQNWSELRAELGDLLLQIVFHAQIAEENREFTMAAVFDAITEKLIRRHPHVFGDKKIASAEEQSVHWEQLKRKEGKTSVLNGVPKALSALLRAQRLQQKASTVGFDWPNADPVWDKIREEIDELQNAADKKDHPEMEEEFGDLLFSLVNVARFLGINPEDALQKTSNKFVQRFQKIERAYRKANKSMNEATLEELDAVWDQIKDEEKKRSSTEK